MTGELILAPDLGGVAVVVKITTAAGMGIPLDGCKAAVGNGKKESSNDASGQLIPFVEKSISVVYRACTGGDACRAIYAPTYAVLNDARGKPLAITYFKEGKNLVVNKEPHQEDSYGSYGMKLGGNFAWNQPHYAEVIYA